MGFGRKNPRNSAKMSSYKDIMEYKCANPDCRSGYDIEVHHIIPISKGGTDEYWNYICLCKQCHLNRGYRLHAEWQDNVTKLFTWKSFIELEKYGFTFDEHSINFESNLKMVKKYGVDEYIDKDNIEYQYDDATRNYEIISNLYNKFTEFYSEVTKNYESLTLSYRRLNEERKKEGS